MRILVFTTLYPNVIQKNHGIFVEKRLLELIGRYPLEAKVIAPVPRYPRWLAQKRHLPEYDNVPLVEQRAGIEIHHPRYPVIPGLSWRIAPLLLERYCGALAAQLHGKCAFDLVDAHFAFPDGVAAARIAHSLGLPFLVTARGSDINDSPNYCLPRQFLRASLHRAAHLIAVSKRLKARMITLGVNGEKISVLPNGVDTEIFQPCRANGIAARYCVNKPFILSVGSLRELKGHHLVIEALATHEELRNYALLIAGDGTMKTQLKQLIAKFNVADRVKLIGEVTNDALPALYSAAELFVLASSNEGCPNVVLEALACNTKVVASDVGAVPDLLPEEMHPYMIKTRTASAIAGQIAACLGAELTPNVARDRAVALGWDRTCSTLYQLILGITQR